MMDQMRSALSTKFQTPEERLNAAIQTALAAYPKEFEPCRRMLIEALQGDAGVLMMIAGDAIRDALTARLRSAALARTRVAGGQNRCDPQSKYVPAPRVPESERGKASRAMTPVERMPPASPTPLADGDQRADNAQSKSVPARPNPSARGSQISDDARKASGTDAPIPSGDSRRRRDPSAGDIHNQPVAAPSSRAVDTARPAPSFAEQRNAIGAASVGAALDKKRSGIALRDVFGKPLHEATPEDCARAAAREEADRAFLEYLSLHVPRGERVGRYFDDEQLTMLYKQFRRDNAA